MICISKASKTSDVTLCILAAHRLSSFAQTMSSTHLRFLGCFASLSAYPCVCPFVASPYFSKWLTPNKQCNVSSQYTYVYMCALSSVSLPTLVPECARCTEQGTGHSSADAIKDCFCCTSYNFHIRTFMQRGSQQSSCVKNVSACNSIPP